MDEIARKKYARFLIRQTHSKFYYVAVRDTENFNKLGYGAWDDACAAQLMGGEL